jgi:hypothetical protein
MCIGGTHYFTWSGGTTGNDPGPSLYCCCGSVKRGDADMMRIIGEQLAAERAARQAAYEKYARLADDHTDLVKEWAIQVQQLAALREGLEQLADVWHDTAHGVMDSVAEMRACRKPVCAETRALLAQPSAEPDNEIRMSVSPGIVGVGVVVSAGPRPELVLEDDPPAGEEDTPA